MIANYNHNMLMVQATVTTITNYGRNTFIIQATENIGAIKTGQNFTLLSFSKSGFFFKISLTICICDADSAFMFAVFATRFGVADVDFFSVDFNDFSACSSSCTARLNSSTVVSWCRCYNKTLFSVVIQAKVFFPSKPFQTSIIIPIKAWSLSK